MQRADEIYKPINHNRFIILEYEIVSAISIFSALHIRFSNMHFCDNLEKTAMQMRPHIASSTQNE